MLRTKLPIALSLAAFMLPAAAMAWLPDSLTAAGLAITIKNDGPGDAFVIADGSAAGVCVSDVTFGGVGNVDLEDFSASAACAEEVAVFQEEHAAVLIEAPWTSGALVDVDANAPVQIPLSIWVATDDIETVNRIPDEVEIARALFLSNFVGIDVQAPASRISDPLTDSKKAFIGSKCSRASAIAASSIYTPRHINIYVVDEVLTSDDEAVSGAYCTRERGIIFLSVSRNPITLAHEVGHALGLSGANGHHGQLAPTNIMKDGKNSAGAERDWLTMGQLYHMAFSDTSFVNLKWDGVALHRVGEPIKDCRKKVAGKSVCPSILLDHDYEND